VASDVTGSPWPGLPALLSSFSSPLHLDPFEPDVARLLQARAGYLVGDVLAKAIDTILMPVTTHSADHVGMRRAGLERRFSVLLLGQIADCDPLGAYLASLRQWAHLIKETTAVRAMEQHAVHCAGQTFALSIHGRALLWTGVCRAATLTMPTRHKREVAGAVASGEHMDATGPVPGVHPNDLFKVSRAYSQSLVHHHGVREVMASCPPQSV
jgi:hypothetical protein